jgi:hypothetical protein
VPLETGAAAEAEIGDNDGGHPVRHVLILLRRHYGKLAATLLLALALGVLWWALVNSRADRLAALADQRHMCRGGN